MASDYAADAIRAAKQRCAQVQREQQRELVRRPSRSPHQRVTARTQRLGARSAEYRSPGRHCHFDRK
jgi:hypothetical protein